MYPRQGENINNDNTVDAEDISVTKTVVIIWLKHLEGCFQLDRIFGIGHTDDTNKTQKSGGNCQRTRIGIRHTNINFPTTQTD